VKALSRGRWVIAAGVGLGLAGLTAALVALARPSAGDIPVRGRPEMTTITRQTLVDVTTVAGKLAYGPEQLIESRLTGTVTGLPAVGTTLARGDTLFRIDDEPVLLLIGNLPAYRELTAGHVAATAGPTAPPSASPSAGRGAATSAEDGARTATPATKGADVKEFEKNLRALGYTGFTVDEQYTQRTAAAARKWQKDQGLPQTGVVELGRVFYAPGPLRVSTLKTSLGALTHGPVLGCTSTVRLVTATLQEHDKALATAGTKLTIALPTGAEVAGKVVSIGPAGDDQPAAGQEPTVQAVVRLDDPAAVDDLDDGPVRVRFTGQQRKNVLVVPVGALLALAEGGYGLELFAGAESRIVPVTTGLFADGKVEISGPDLRERTTVGMAK